jgi:hypothetical protein
VHNAVHHAYGKEASALHHGGENTSHGKVPEASFHKDHNGKEFINFAPPAEKTRGVTAPESKSPEAKTPDGKPIGDAYKPPANQAEADKMKVDNAINNFTNSFDSRYATSRAPMEQSRVDDLAKATKGMDGNMVATEMQNAMPNYKVSKPDENGNINVDRKPVIDRGQDTRAFQLNTEKGAGIVINSDAQDGYKK